MKKTILTILITFCSLLVFAEYHIEWVTVEPDTIYMDDNLTYAEIEVCIYDEENDPVSGERVNFDCDLGSCLGYDFTNSNGIAETTFWEADDGPGTATIVIRIGSTVLGEVQVEILEVVSAEDELPNITTAGNYPNPFNPTTTIFFTTSTATGDPRLVIYNSRGQKVRDLTQVLEGTYSNGSSQNSFSVEWDGRDDSNRAVSNGTYFYLISIEGERYKGKMTLLK